MSKLPEKIGINEKHNDLKSVFLTKILAQIQGEEVKMKSYAITEEYGVQETVKLETSDYYINLNLVKR